MPSWGGSENRYIRALAELVATIMAFLQLAGGYWADKRGRKAITNNDVDKIEPIICGEAPRDWT
ncbi:hypothetical protein KEJ37_02095 [Candidatus Bathyarchaeota archaeon]|nr:hypothetical protein [Candidatus Bathyarchaeota archaeon]